MILKIAAFCTKMWEEKEKVKAALRLRAETCIIKTEKLYIINKRVKSHIMVDIDSQPKVKVHSNHSNFSWSVYEKHLFQFL